MLRFIIFQEENMNNLCVIRRGILIVNLGGDLDHHVTEMIRDEIDKKINGQKVHTITFNFRNVSFMDSAGIGLLMGRYRKIKEIGGENICKQYRTGCTKNIQNVRIIQNIKNQQGNGLLC